MLQPFHQRPWPWDRLRLKLDKVHITQPKEVVATAFAPASTSKTFNSLLQSPEGQSRRSLALSPPLLIGGCCRCGANRGRRALPLYSLGIEFPFRGVCLPTSHGPALMAFQQGETLLCSDPGALPAGFVA